MSYTETHFHLLAGLDDGPATIEESLALARAAVADGTRTVLATPHVHPRIGPEVSAIADAVHELTAELARARIPLEVRAGGELSHEMAGRLSQDELEAIAHGPPGCRWVLLEAAFAGMDENYTAAADELRERGFAVVVAHPERAAPSPATSAALRREIEVGSALQLTAWSLTGRNGDPARVLAWRLLHSAPRVVIASDAHNLDRGPSLRAAVAALAAGGAADPEQPVDAAPRALLERGLAIPPAALVA